MFQNNLFACAVLSAYYDAYFGQGTGPILMDNVACSGLELRLLDCPYNSDTSDRTHAEDVGVHCQLC